MFYVRVEPMKLNTWHCNNKSKFQLQALKSWNGINKIRNLKCINEDKFEIRLSLIIGYRVICFIYRTE